VTAHIIALTTGMGRHGYRLTAAMVHRAGWAVNRKGRREDMAT